VKPRREKFDFYWKKRPEDMYSATKKEAAYWFNEGRKAEMRDLNRIWEYKKLKSASPDETTNGEVK
jgi:hypothetical protein